MKIRKRSLRVSLAQWHATTYLHRRYRAKREELERVGVIVILEHLVQVTYPNLS